MPKSESNDRDWRRVALMRKMVLIAALCVIAGAVWGDAGMIYDDFEGEMLDESKWERTTEFDRFSVLRVNNGHLEIYGNGKWRGVRSTSLWCFPEEGKDGFIDVIFKIRTALHHTPSGHVASIFDSSVGLIEESPDAEGRTRKFGFLMTWPEYSGGKYKVSDGGEWLQTQQPFTQSIKDYDFVRVRIGRKEGKPFCLMEYSKDGNQWTTLHFGSPQQLPKAVRIFASSCWGALALDYVQVAVEGSVREEGKPMTEPAKLSEKDKLIPFVYACKIPKGTTLRLDGQLDDAVWSKAMKVTLTHRLGTTKPPTQMTTAMVAYDSRHLYIAFECYEERMDLLRTIHKDPSGAVWQDDCVEVFIQPDPVNQPAYYFQAVVNALGVKWDSFGFHQQWQAFAQRKERGWTVEMAIPFQAIGAEPPKPGDCWGINFTREERPHDELTSWSPVQGHFHDPERFGRIVFGEMDVKVSGVGVIDEERGKVLLVRLTSGRHLPSGAKLAVSISDKSMTMPVQAETLRCPIPDLPAGQYRCAIAFNVPGQPQLKTVIPFYHPGRIGLNSALWPVEVYGNTLYLSNGGLSPVWLLVSDTKSRQEGYEVVIEMPEWMDVLDPPTRKEHGNCPDIGAITRKWTQRDTQRYRQVKIEVNSPPTSTPIDKVETWMQPLLLWFSAKVPDGVKLPLQGWLYTTIRRSGETEPTRRTKVVVLPAEKGSQPKRIPIFIWLHGPAVPEQGWKALLEHYQRLGVTGLQEGISDPRFDELAKQYGISTMRSLWWFWWAPNYLKGHPGDAAINAEGKPADLRLGMVCPEVLLAEGSEAFEEAFTRIVTQDKGSPIGWNWDLEGPGVWSVCFCHRCMEAFRKFAEIEPERKLDFETIRSDERLREKWIKFALSQTTRMVKKWSERIAQERPDAGLYINGGSPIHDDVITAGRLPWRDVLPYIKGGMFFYYCNSPLASRSRHAELVRAFEMVGDVGTPLWTMLSVGYNRVEEVYHYHYPDLTTLQMLQSVLTGYRGIHFWSYRGFDGRFNNAVARATRIISQFEDWLLNGKKVELPEKAIISPHTVLAVAWEYNEEVAFFILNFDPMRDAWVRIVPAQLPMKIKNCVSATTGEPISTSKPLRIPKLGILIVKAKIEKCL